MKKLLVTLAAVLVSVSAFAQGSSGSINLKNNGVQDASGATVNVPITGDTTGATAQLFLVGSSGTLTALTPTTTFRTGAAAPYLSATVVDVPGTTPGGSATFRLRAWVGSSFDTATAKGESANFTVSGLGGDKGDGSPPLTPPNLNGLQTFAIVPIPEPSTIALGALGAAALLLRRRK